ncbi:MAG TPA: Spy/CpxP family protein refolding chaperone [Dongiaceae bacterium]|nr:Spy/CpxP family protein refolding chaperone [Dongiaceae bacterium]
MKRKAFPGVFPATIVVVLVSFLSVVLLADPSISFAAGKKKSPAVSATSAVDHTEARIAKLQGALKITDAQKELWNNLTQVMRENAQEMDALSKDKAEVTKTMNAVERLKFHSQITEAQLNHQKKIIPPFEALYTSMSDEQKKITDTIFRTGKHGKHKIN